LVDFAGLNLANAVCTCARRKRDAKNNFWHANRFRILSFRPKIRERIFPLPDLLVDFFAFLFAEEKLFGRVERLRGGNPFFKKGSLLSRSSHSFLFLQLRCCFTNFQFGRQNKVLFFGRRGALNTVIEQFGSRTGNVFFGNADRGQLQRERII